MKVLTQKLLAGAATAGLILGATGVASADDVYNTLDSSIDSVAEVMALNAGGTAGTTTLYVRATDGDGKPNCNIVGNKTLEVSVTSSNTAVATVSPSSITFTNCTDGQLLTVTPGATVGSSTVSLTQRNNTTGGTFDLAPATFTVDVAAAAPSNTAPTVRISGVTGGASYNKGSVPVATCEVSDTEDGSSSFPATLSVIEGQHASDGIGSRTAECSYTDRGRLTETASVVYSIIDPTAPTVGSTLTPRTPDGSNGWYRTNVTLTWSVSEPESPNSLAKIGCVDQGITADQQETAYTCSATSAGGSTTGASVTVKRDGTPPVISGANVNNTAWRNTPLSADFTAEDALSGLANDADGSFDLTATDESTNATTPTRVSKTVADQVGNSSTRTLSAFIDVTKPTSTISGPIEGAVYVTPPTVSCVGSDALSGIASPGTVSGNDSTAGRKTVTCNGANDRAGNIQTDASPAVRYTIAPMGSFNSNFDGNAVLRVKTNQAIPLKWAFFDGTINFDLLKASPEIGAEMTSVSSTRCSSVEGTDGTEMATELAAGASGLQLLSDKSYQMNWKAPTTTGCRALTVKMYPKTGGSLTRTILVNIVK